MDESDSKERVVPYTSVMTGDEVTDRQMLYQIRKGMRSAVGIDLMVSFLMESGVRMLLTDLVQAVERGVRIRILTGGYLGITQPSALYLLQSKLGNQVEMRFYNDTGRSFHPKAYFFHYGHRDEVFIGSSNISRSALTSGIEWNYRLRSEVDFESYTDFYGVFKDLYENHSFLLDEAELKRYSDNWHRPEVLREIGRQENELEKSSVEQLFQPRGAQIEALYTLGRTRDEGASRALLHVATGVGKTFLAAFDSSKFQSILFVAHREEILKQAARAFSCVRQSDDYGFFCGDIKDTKHSMIFASVATLGRKQYLSDEYFPPDTFDYIVVDEFHHAVNDSYMNIIQYFKPKFLLGLTATPERMDGRNIYAICDYNVPFELSLFDAINKGMLVPFHYYGVYDDTNYSDIHLVRGKYSDQDLNRKYIGNTKRINCIVKHYKKYHSQRAIGFCATREHAENMADAFNNKKIPSVSVYSNAEGPYAEARDVAINRLKKGEIQVIFVVDMFNEGVDIPALDMVMFLRPTESPTIFLQQLGRGLRIYKDKSYLNVLDFIGNYEKAGILTTYLTKDNGFGKAGHPDKNRTPIYPDDCMVDFDIRLIDLFEQMEKRNKTKRDIILEEFYRIKEALGHVPSRTELFYSMDAAIYELCMTYTAGNPFKRYLEYLQKIGELGTDEEALYRSVAREFIEEIETTQMTKVYKMPVLSAFYNNGDIRMEITEDQALEAWKRFFDHGTNWKDCKKGISYEEYKKITDEQHRAKIRTMPIKHLVGKIFQLKDGCALSIRENIKPFIRNTAFIKQFDDVITYRALDYYRRRYVEK